MARRDATPKQTGGGGYDFENEVVAYVLAHLLDGRPPVERLAGPVVRLDVQEPASRWHLDDLVFTLDAPDAPAYLAASVKSSAQFGVSSFPADFVRDAWEQLLGTSSDAFVEGRDQLALVSAPAPHVQADVNDLLARARAQDPADLDEDVSLPSRANDTVRGLLASAACPPDLATSDEAVPAGRLLRHVLWLPFDLDAASSERRATAKRILQDALVSGDAAEAERLWATLKDIAWELRTASGDITREALVASLRPTYALIGSPDHRADWNLLRDSAREAAERVPHRIGNRISLPRAQQRRAIAAASGPAIVLLGASGVGKSVIARHEAEAALASPTTRVLWASADRLDRGEITDGLGLAHVLPTLIRHDAAPGVLVLDQLDQIYDDSAFARAASLLRACGLDGTCPSTAWRALLTCTPEAWPRVQDALGAHGIPPIPSLSIEAPDPDELAPVWEAFPSLSPLRLRRHLVPVLLRPKVLDLLARRSTAGLDLATVGESHLAVWFWDHQIDTGPHALDRAAASSALARLQADGLVSDVRVDAAVFDSGQRQALESLAGDSLVTRHADRVAFEHDLYGDWVRLRDLRAEADAGRLVSFLTERLDSPVWHRALRLYGLYLIEHNDGLAAWQAAFDALGGLGDAAELARDLLLEASAHTVGSAAALASLWPALVADDGILLDRLLQRLLHSATVPNTVLRDTLSKSDPGSEPYISAIARVPYGPYWYAPLSVLHAHRTSIPVRARASVARVAELWLRSTLREWPLREETAALAVALGEETLRLKEGQGSIRYDDRTSRDVYQAVLASASHDPAPAVEILLEAAGRRPQRFVPPPPTARERAETEAYAKRRGVPLTSPFGPDGPVPPPWPDGPSFGVDRALQHVVFETGALAPLVSADPKHAVELLLALLISPPTARSLYDERRLDDVALAGPRWHPPFYTRGPFLRMLAIDEDAGVDAIIRLVNHATDQWVVSNSEWSQRYNGGPAEPFVLTLTTPEGDVQTVGDNRVFAWHLNGPTSEGTLASALMALEKHIYDRIDAGDDVAPLVERLFRDARSTAVIGLLVSIGLGSPNLFDGPLRPLLTSPTLFSWTIRGSQAQGWETAIMPPFSLLPASLHADFRAWHQLPHRRRSLVDIALYFLTNVPSFEETFADARARWARDAEEGGPDHGWDYIPTLLAQFDPVNWVVGDPVDGQAVVVFRPPPEQQVRNEEAQSQFAAAMIPLTVPIHCARLLDGDEEATPEVLEELWQKAQAAEALGPEAWRAEPLTLLDVQAGVAAVLAVYGGSDLLAERSTWARDRLLEAAAVEPEDSFGPSMWDARALAAKGIPGLWATMPEDLDVRQAVAHLALTAPAAALTALMIRTKNLRARLGDDHRRLIHLVLLRSRIERRLGRARQFARYSSGEDDGCLKDDVNNLTAERDALAASFVDATLEPAIPTARALSVGLDSSGELQEDSSRYGRPRPVRPLADEIIVAAYQGVPVPVELDGESWDTWSDIWGNALQDVLTPLRLPDDAPTEDLDGTDPSWDTFVVAVAAVIAAANVSEAEARSFRRPVLQLGPSASSLVTRFLSRWWLEGIIGMLPRVLNRWATMVEEVSGMPRWSASDQGAWHLRGPLWRDLVGLQQLLPETWPADRQPVVAALTSSLESWAKSHLRSSDDAVAFAAFLTFPAADVIRLDGMVWLSEAARLPNSDLWRDYSSRDTEHGRAASMVAQLLVHVWVADRAALQQREPAFKAFRHLLGLLVTRRLPVALELAQRVGGG